MFLNMERNFKLKSKECQTYLTKMQELEQQLKQQSKLQCQVDNSGLNRRNLTKSKWYNKNKTHHRFAHYLFGMYETWEEKKHFIGTLFPEVDVNYFNQ